MPILHVYLARKHLLDYVLEEPRVVIGRGGECQVRLDNEAVSRQHVLIREHPRGWIVEDMSSNGLFVNGAATEKRALRDGDRIEVAQYVLVFDARAVPKSAERQLVEDVREATGDDGGYDVGQEAIAEAAAEIQAKPQQKKTTFLSPEEMQKLRDNVAMRRQAHVAWVGADGRQEVPLDAEEHVIGWSAESDIRLPGKRRLIKEPAYIFRVPAGHQLEATSLWRPVKVRGVRIKRYILRDGDEIVVGGVKIVYKGAVD
jgi:pSer/pThr/pTyr-binding forkhead associated (FHA) protein